MGIALLFLSLYYVEKRWGRLDKSLMLGERNMRGVKMNGVNNAVPVQGKGHDAAHKCPWDYWRCGGAAVRTGRDAQAIFYGGVLYQTFVHFVFFSIVLHFFECIDNSLSSEAYLSNSPV